MNEIRVLSPTAILGYGYPRESLERGMAMKPDVIAVDGGSTDGGPYYLGIQPGSGGGQARAFLEFLSRDTAPLLDAALDAEIPLIVGSAGFAGADLHLMGALSIVFQHAAKTGRKFKLASIHAEIDKEYIKRKIREGKISPLGPIPELTEAEVDASSRIVAQMGVEPFTRALEAGAQVIIAGRANDPSMFAALPMLRGFDTGLALHMAKILECGAIAASPGSGSDAMMGTLRPDHFELEPCAAERRCTTMSVAAHSLYEKSDPYRLFGPGGHVDLTDVSFEQASDRAVRVRGSRFVRNPQYQLKLEGSKPIGWRTIALAGIRDPAAIAHVDELTREAEVAVRRQYPDLDPATHRIFFHAYGKNAVMGPCEPYSGPPAHEIGLLIEVVTPDEGLSTAICGFARSLILHHGFPGRISTAGNIASPFSPLDIPAGQVFEFNVYHLVDEDDPLALFPMDLIDV